MRYQYMIWNVSSMVDPLKHYDAAAIHLTYLGEQGWEAYAVYVLQGSVFHCLRRQVPRS